MEQVPRVQPPASRGSLITAPATTIPEPQPSLLPPTITATKSTENVQPPSATVITPSTSAEQLTKTEPLPITPPTISASTPTITTQKLSPETDEKNYQEFIDQCPADNKTNAIKAITYMNDIIPAFTKEYSKDEMKQLLIAIIGGKNHEWGLPGYINNATKLLTNLDYQHTRLVDKFETQPQKYKCITIRPGKEHNRKWYYDYDNVSGKDCPKNLEKITNLNSNFSIVRSFVFLLKNESKYENPRANTKPSSNEVTVFAFVSVAERINIISTLNHAIITLLNENPQIYALYDELVKTIEPNPLHHKILTKKEEKIEEETETEAEAEAAEETEEEMRLQVSAEEINNELEKIPMSQYNDETDRHNARELLKKILDNRQYTFNIDDVINCIKMICKIKIYFMSNLSIYYPDEILPFVMSHCLNLYTEELTNILRYLIPDRLLQDNPIYIELCNLLISPEYVKPIPIHNADEPIPIHNEDEPIVSHNEDEPIVFSYKK